MASADIKSVSTPNRMATLIEQPIIPTLCRMAAPNALGFFVASCVSIAEMWFVGQLGTASLAGLALAFPLVMLMQMQSNGSVGGVIAAMVARAMGAGDIGRANGILWHAIGVGSILSAVYAGLYFLFGEMLFQFLGGNSEALKEALTYGNFVFALIFCLWMFNMCGSVLRGAGDMQSPATGMVVVAAVQVTLSGLLCLGGLGLPALGIKGIAIGTIVAQATGWAFLTLRLRSGRSSVRFTRHALKLDGDIIRAILKNGMIATVNPFLTVISIIVITAFVGRYGVAAIAGYGIGTRLEFILIPIVFGFGAAMISLVGSNIGAGRIVKAEQVGWTGAGISAVICGLIGLTVALFPMVWADHFSQSAEVLNVSYNYLKIVGPFYFFFGLGLSLFFASQGAHALTWPVIANLIRLGIAVGGGYVAIQYFKVELDGLMGVVSASLAAYGIIVALALKFGAWRRANPDVMP
ncbi:MAG: MATE family efflux transporter [Sneathiella sp.]|nr:MATE family efflux transporter [Sneathiella sp.]